MDELARTVLESINDFVRSQFPNTERLDSHQLGHGFCKWCLQDFFELTDDEAEEAMEVGGPGDNEVDAIFLLEDHLYVVQTKFNKSHSWEAIAGFVESVRQLQNNQVAGKRPEVLEAAAKIRAHLADDKKVFFYYITNAEFSKSDTDHIKSMKLSSSFQILDLELVCKRLQDRVVELPENFRSRDFRLTAEVPPIEIDKTLTMPVKLVDLARFVSDTKDYLYHSNIRNYLKRTSINKGIEDTLSRRPDKFWLFNNGITVVCEDYHLDGRIVAVRTPQVVNGCQTASTIAAFMRGKDQQEQNAFQGRVLVRVIKDASAEERAEITRYTNSQNSVKGKDFLSLDNFQKRLKARLELLGYHYEVQRGSYSIMARNLKGRFKGAPEYAYLTPESAVTSIPAADAVQGYVAAFLQLPDVAYARPSELMPLGERYKDVFNADTPEDPEYFLLPTLTVGFAVQGLNYGHGGEDYRRYGRWFFVSVVFRTLLRLLKQQDIIDQHSVPRDIPSAWLRRVFANRGLAHELLLTVENVILDYYFRDSAVRDLTRDDTRNFFKARCTSPQAQHILDQHIADCFVGKNPKGKKALNLFDAMISAG